MSAHPTETVDENIDGHFGEHAFERIATSMGLSTYHTVAYGMPVYLDPETEKLWRIWKLATLWAQERIENGESIWSNE